MRTNPIPPVVTWFSARDVNPFEVHAALLAPGPVLWDGTTTTVMLFGHGPAVDADRELLSALGKFEPCQDPGRPAGHRWSLSPSDLRGLERHGTGDFIAEVGVGVVHCANPQPPVALSAGVRVIHERMKAEFDPTGRLNPGRIVGFR